MLWINNTHLWIALAATLFLVVFHYLSPWFANHLPGDGRAFISFAGGVAVSYVFLHMLPNLVEYNKPIGILLINNQWLTPFTELTIYIVALCGFLIYYGLDLLAEGHQKQGHQSVFAYNLHLTMFCLYNFIITYTMSLRALVSLTATILFTVAMALHFVLTDRKFSRLYRDKFNRWGRYLLILALLSGWIFTVVFDPVNVLVVAFMVAFLAGSVLLNVFREELPGVGFASFGWFALGSGLIASVLLLQTWVVVTNR